MSERDELVSTLDTDLRAIADALLAYYNPCAINGSACRGGNPNPCCYNTIFGPGLCRYWQGHCVHPNTECKVWLCKTALNSLPPEGVEAFRQLEAFAYLFGLAGHPLIGEPYYGADKVPLPPIP